MRLSTDRRLFLLLAAGLVALAGCDNKPKGTGGTGTTTAAGPAASNELTPRQAAEEMLNDIGAAKVGPRRMSTNFREHFAGPGQHSETVALEWVNQFQGGTFVIGEETRAGDAYAFRGLAKFPDKSMAFSLRLVHGPAGYLVDWLHRSERQGSGIKTPADPDLAAAQDAVRNFLDVMLGGDPRQAQGMMALDWKKKMAPAQGADARKGVEYDVGFINQTMKAWKRDVLGYSLTTGELGPNKDTATFVATLDSGSAKTPWVVKAVKDTATGQWLVGDFDKQ